MASFQIHRDTNEKKIAVPGLDEKSTVLGTKQPLAVIGGKDKGQRANFAVLNGNIPRAVPDGKIALRDVGNLKATGDESSGYAGVKKSNVVPVVEQFKAFCVYEDNSETQVVQPQPRAGKPLPNAAEKENLCGYEPNIKFDSMDKFAIQHDYSLDGTPMSVTDVLSPMSVDRSLAHISSDSSSKLSEDTNDQVAAKVKDGSTVDGILSKDAAPRNDRQRFFEVVQYQLDILENFRESEKKHRPKPQYMLRQNDINQSMRVVLVDWLVEVSEEYNLDTETLYLSVSYIDRFLSQMSVVRSKLQLVGTAAMYIASKYEEIYPPDVSEFVFITDDTYTKAQVLRMEQIILKILSFDLCTPTPYVFINAYSVLCDITDKLKYLAMYISELSLMNADPYLNYLPSLISAAALALSRHILGLKIWTPELQEITNYKLSDLKDVVLHLSKSHKAAIELNTQAIRDKYNRDKYKNVSSIEATEINETIFNELCQAYYADTVSQQQKEQKNVNSKSKVNLLYKF